MPRATDDADKRGTPRAVSIPPARKLEIYERDHKAAKMRRDGHTWDEIAIALSYANKAKACEAVKRRMIEARDLAYGEVELYRIESIDRLEALLRAVWDMAMKGSDKHVESARRLIKQISDLRGEAQPIKVEIGESDVDRLLREAQDEFARRAAELDRQTGGVQAPPVADR